MWVCVRPSDDVQTCGQDSAEGGDGSGGAGSVGGLRPVPQDGQQPGYTLHIWSQQHLEMSDLTGLDCVSVGSSGAEGR